MSDKPEETVNLPKAKDGWVWIMVPQSEAQTWPLYEQPEDERATAPSSLAHH